MKTRILLVLLAPMLWSCATAETRPAVDASAYLFDLEVTVDPQLSGFDPDVAKGGGSGALRGAGMGFGGCIYVGASLDGASNGGAFPVGTALGILVSPACALVGGVAGGGLAETKEDVAARTLALNDMARELDYPTELARILADDLKAGPIYHIAQSPDEEQGNKDIADSTHDRNVDERLAPEAVPEPEAALALVNADTDEAKEAAGDPGDYEEILTAPLIEDTSLVPVKRPTEPNASIYLNITNYGFTGKGVDPKLPLQISATLCVTQYETGEALAFQTLSAASKPMKLEDWAQIGKEGLEAETRSLLHRISEAAQAAMGRQVKLNYKTSCGRRSMFGQLIQPMS